MIPRYEILYAPAAAKEQRKLDPTARAKVERAIESLALDPRPHGCRKLSGHSDLWRIRVGDYRIVYAIRAAKLVILIVRVGTRGQIYRGL